MHVQCPRCNATIHLEDPQDGPQIVKCWMCQATIDTPHPDPAPKTIRASSSNSRENLDPVALRINSSAGGSNAELSIAERIRLEIVFGPAQGTEFEITKSLVVIGRKGGGADIEIDDPEVSRSHCAIEVRQDGILLHDLRSTNGTYLRGSPITLIRLAAMSIFRIGTSHLRVKSAN
jgi:pSer/pThr/pTyr-binding forkhead associated (FHA) protein